jgi:BASS family bile acid:Na+ symporter
MASIDQVQLSFNPQTLTVLNIVLGLVMFGVALELKVADFRAALKTPKALALGLLGHHILFPAMTYVLIWILQPLPSIALGMILVSSCPAGHISNFLVHYARGNTALSVSVSALSTAVALVMTPLNFAFWGNLHPVTSPLMKQVAMSPWEMLQVIVLLLGIPLVLGMWVARSFPAFARRVRKPMKWLSLLVLAGVDEDLFVRHAQRARHRGGLDELGARPDDREHLHRSTFTRRVPPRPRVRPPAAARA